MDTAAHAAPAPLATYLSEVGAIPVLSREEERRLAVEFRRTRDPRVAQLLVRANLRFVIQVARAHRRGRFPLADLVQEGNLGLVEAVEHFDPDRGVRLVTYAAHWIRSRILNHVLGAWSMVRVATTASQRRLFFSLARTEREVTRGLDPSEPHPAEVLEPLLARCLGVPRQAIAEMRRRLDERDLSLDGPRPGPSGELPDGSEGGGRPDDLLATAEEAALATRRVRAALACLDERERLVVELRFLGEPALTLQAVGARIGCGPERARQLEARAREKLRRCLAACGGAACGGGACQARRRVAVPAPLPAPPGYRPAST